MPPVDGPTGHNTRLTLGGVTIGGIAAVTAVIAQLREEGLSDGMIIALVACGTVLAATMTLADTLRPMREKKSSASDVRTASVRALVHEVVQDILSVHQPVSPDPARSVPPALVSSPPRSSVAVEPLWLTIARQEIGQQEVAGPEDNPRIVEYQRATTLRATDDETPWCAAFVGWCLERAGVPSTRSARARSYEEWGRPVSMTAPVPGCIAVFWRGSKDSGQGHVGFYVGGSVAAGSVDVLGGNQSNSVKVSTYGTDKLLGFRWPEDSQA